MADALTESLKELRAATEERTRTKLTGPSLESLDEKVCLAGRKVFVRYVDAAGVSDRPDERITQECLEAMKEAFASLASSTAPTEQYAGARRYSDSVGEKVEMLRRIAGATSVRTVLREKVASLFGEDARELVH
jgi:hypothetical protein